MAKVLIKKLDSAVQLPAYKSTGASGMDLMAFIKKPINVKPNSSSLIPTGLSVAFPENFEIQIRPRSGLAAKNNISVLNTPGTIDSDYRGEIKVIIYNHSNKDFVINNDNVLNYVNFNFVGTQFSNPTIDASSMTHLHLDVFIPGAVQAGTSLTLILRDFGPDGQDGGGDDTDISASFNSSTLVQGAWNSLDIPIAGMANKSALGLLIYEGSSLPNFYADNIFFYN